MTVVNKQNLPALDNSGKVKDPNLNDIGERNYTSTILKYGNLAVPFPQLKTDAKTIVPAINELHDRPSGGSTVIPNPEVGASLEAESGESLETESGVVLEIDGQGGGSIVGPLNTVSIDGDIYSVEGGGGTYVVANPAGTAQDTLSKLQVDTTIYEVSSGATYTAGNAINISNQNVISVDFLESTPENIAQASIDNPTSLCYTPGLLPHTSLSTASITLFKDNWETVSSTLQQTISLLGITSTTYVVCSPDYHTASEYMQSGIYVINQSLNSITFATSTQHVPADNIIVNLIFW